MNSTAHVRSLTDALAEGPPPEGNLAVPIFAHGSLEVELYTPAGQVHRFEQFSDDFAVWVAFYGPEGGEAGAR